MKLKKGPPDLVLFIISMILISFGLVMVFSSSAVATNLTYDDPYFYFKRQLQWVLIGLVAMVMAMKTELETLRRWAVPLLSISLILLLLLFTPLGVEVNNATRWISLGPLGRFAPTELAKIAIVLFMALSMERNIDKIQSFRDGILPYLLILGIFCALILAQPDLGTAVALAGTIFFMMVAAGMKHTHILGLAGLGVAGVGMMIKLEPYRLLRFSTWMDPWQDPLGDGYQIIQSLYALGSGGIFGVGLGFSRQKWFYLPEQHTDFIFAIIGEELGYLGVMSVILLFLLFAWRGFRIAMRSPNNFCSLLAMGLTVMIVFQAIINIAVVSGAIPVTGITLPFISYGGTSLLFTMIATGLLLNVSRYSNNQRNPVPKE